MIDKDFYCVIDNLYHINEQLHHAFSTIDKTDKPLSSIELDRFKFHADMIKNTIDKISKRLV